MGDSVEINFFRGEAGRIRQDELDQARKDAVDAAIAIGNWLRSPEGQEVLAEIRRTPAERRARLIAMGEQDPLAG